MSKHSSIVTAICIAGLLQACASSKALHYKDGTEVHVVHCTGPSWVGCLEKASAICKTGGYDVVEKSTAKSSGFFSSTENRELIIRCKSSAPAPATAAPVTVAPSGAIIAPAGPSTVAITAEPATPSTPAPQAPLGNVTPPETTSPAANTKLPADVPGNPANTPEAKAR